MAALGPEPLPLNTYDLATEVAVHDAYEQCLMMEASAGTDTDHMLARCLGYFIRELPNEAKELLVQDIAECSADCDKTKSLSWLYISHLIRLFRQNKSCTPPSLELSSRSSFEMQRGVSSETMKTVSTSLQSAKQLALKRDNYRCVVTGWADTSSLDTMEVADLQRYNLSPASVHCTTNYCHIFPPSINWGFDSNYPAEKKNKDTGNIRAIIESCRRIDILSDPDFDENIRHLENGFTVEKGLCVMYDKLELWFEHDADDTYRICALDPKHFPFFGLPHNPTITFTSTDPSLPLPDSRYLRLHAAVCRVAHLSGAAKYLDLEDRAFEELGVLARDGSSADLLASRLTHLALMV